MKSRTHSVLQTGFFLFTLCACAGAQTPAPAHPDPARAAAAAPDTTQPAMGMTKPHDNQYVIGSTDVLTINVWKQPEISQTLLPVRSDGKISLPLAGEVQAAGRTPYQLEQEITAKLRSYMADPEVTVMVEQSNSEKFNILGFVARPGSYPLTGPTTVLDAIADAGGFRDFAKTRDVYVLRHYPGGKEIRLRFNYKAVIKGKHFNQNVQLQPNDTIVVP
jgi:polysaccharide export outer membrane protein